MIPPNFDNDEIKEKFNSILMNNINFYMNQTIEDINNKQNIIDNIYSQLTLLDYMFWITWFEKENASVKI